jgi:hypothetical protein
LSSEKLVNIKITKFYVEEVGSTYLAYVGILVHFVVLVLAKFNTVRNLPISRWTKYTHLYSP